MAKSETTTVAEPKVEKTEGKAFMGLNVGFTVGLIQLWSVMADHARNICRTYGALDFTPWRIKLAISHAEEGVLPTAEIACSSPVEGEERKRLFGVRKAVHDACKAVADIKLFAFGKEMTITGNDLFVAFLETFGKAKDGAKALVAGGHRREVGYNRHSCYILANAIRMKEGLEPITEVQMVTFDRTLTEDEAMHVNVMENSYKAGEDISWVQKLVIGQKYRKQAYGFSAICRVLNIDPKADSSERGRLTNVLTISENWPELDVVGKFVKGEIDQPASKYMHSKTAGWARPQKQKGANKDAPKLWATGKVEKPKAEEVLAFLKNPQPATTSYAMTAKERTTASKNNRNPYVVETLGVVEDKRKRSVLEELDLDGEACGFLRKVCAAGENHRGAITKMLKDYYTKEVWSKSDEAKPAKAE